jgi:hypothetical protein
MEINYYYVVFPSNLMKFIVRQIIDHYKYVYVMYIMNLLSSLEDYFI